MSNIPKFPVSVHLVIIKNNKILLLKRKNTGFSDGMYSLPAGKLEHNESVSQGIIRESLEEINIKLTKFKIIHVMNRLGDDFNRIDYFFLAEDYTGVIKNNELNKCSEIKWFDINKLPNNTIEYVKYAIQCIQKKQAFSEYNWDKEKRV